MSKKIRLTESDLRYMVRKAVNEILSMEGGEDSKDRYYFGDGWNRRNDLNNPFTAEGAVGENFEEFVSQLQEYVDKKIEEYKQRKGRIQKALDNFLKNTEERHKRYSRQTQRKHEAAVRFDNRRRGTNYPEFLKPGGGIDYYLYDKYMKDIENEEEDNKRWLANELKIVVEMPSGAKESWEHYALIAPPEKSFPINPDNVEESAKQAWELFNMYAKQTHEVIGWYLWQWSTFKPTIRPILTPEVGEKIQRTSDEVSAYYDSKPSGGFTGD